MFIMNNNLFTAEFSESFPTETNLSSIKAYLLIILFFIINIMEYRTVNLLGTTNCICIDAF